MLKQEAEKRLEDVAPRLGRPTAEEKAVLFEHKADIARLRGQKEASRELALMSVEAALEVAEQHSGEIAVSHVIADTETADSQREVA